MFRKGPASTRALKYSLAEASSFLRESSIAAAATSTATATVIAVFFPNLPLIQTNTIWRSKSYQSSIRLYRLSSF
jgi:hypothetical protein